MPRPAVKSSTNHLRAWRERLGITQEELADRVGTAGNVIGLLESGERGLSHKWLLKLAPALETSPGFLLDYDPNDVDGEYLREVLDVPKERRAEAIAHLRVLKGVR